MATVVAAAQESLAPVVSLYVNGYNDPARRAYEPSGIRPDRNLRHRAVLSRSSQR